MDENPEKVESSLNVSIIELEKGLPNSRPKRKSAFLRRIFTRDNSHESPWPKLVRRGLYLFAAAITILAVGGIIYHSLLFHLTRVITPPRPSDTGLTRIVNSWVEPGSTVSWLPDFSRDISPKPIHSHNDYWRRVPLFEALSLGITGVEADCHLVNGELFVGHTASSLTANRTLKSLYLDPLTTILQNQNAANGIASSSGINGVWDVKSSRGLVLMTDLKTEGFSTLAAVQQQLTSFREAGWLTYWNGTVIVPGPITHVATGNTPFAAVLNSTFANSTYRDVFFDAPLATLTDAYNVSNSYYTSTSLTSVVGGKSKIPPSGLSKAQMNMLKAQIEKADSLGLVSRYWDIPSWPVSRRMTIWKQLEVLGIGMLNADAIEQASLQNWRWCNIMGLQLC